VDDEPDLLDQLVKMLTVQRYDVDTAADGEAALDKLFENPYDLVVLDIMLPRIDGLAVLKEMRGFPLHTGRACLGLSIVKRIIELHGGRIDIESEPAAGTRVNIFLP
jgi:CheY-like chemotaxis protein